MSETTSQHETGEPGRNSLSLPRILTPADTAALPARVARSIAAHDNASEVLVRLLQLVIVAIFGVLYAVSPKTSAGTDFSPVPYVLGAYGVFTVAGLFVALRVRLPDIAVYAMTFVDIALLMAMIWSFHVQYQQPASFYLKAPTLLYIFIFISLRALRFEARFVIAAGLAALLGWMSLVGYAVVTGADNMMVTRDYVTYLTTNSILIGAELDKMIAILSVTLILALAVHRGRSLLVEAVREETAARELSRFFDPGVAGRIRAASSQIHAGEGVSREAAILNIDIRGFTALASRLAPAEVVCVLSAYQDRLVPVIQRHGGTIDKFMGDGIMASFGAAAPSPTAAADCLRAVDAIIAEVDGWQGAEGPLGRIAPLDVNMAVADGPVVFGAVGSDDRLEFTVIGRAVNLSAKLEKYNKDLRSRALATADTLERATAQGYVAARAMEIIEARLPGTEGNTEVVRLY